MNKKEREKMKKMGIDFYDDSEDEYTYTVYKLRRVLSGERIGFIYYGYIDNLGGLDRDFLNRTWNEPYALTKDYIYIIDSEDYTSKEEAERSLNSFLNENEPE